MAKIAKINGTPIPTTQPITMLRFFLDSPELWLEDFPVSASAVEVDVTPTVVRKVDKIVLPPTVLVTVISWEVDSGMEVIVDELDEDLVVLLLVEEVLDEVLEELEEVLEEVEVEEVEALEEEALEEEALEEEALEEVLEIEVKDVEASTVDDEKLLLELAVVEDEGSELSVLDEDGSEEEKADDEVEDRKSEESDQTELDRAKEDEDSRVEVMLVESGLSCWTDGVINTANNSIA